MERLIAQGPTGILTSALAAATSLGLAYVLLLRPIYYLAFDPLRHYPGPKLWAMSRLPLTFSLVSGRHHKKLLELHIKYGDVVRIAPTQLSFVKPEAWKEIIGHRKNGAKENRKDPNSNARTPENILDVGREKHSILRRNLSHGFSAKRMIEQEPLITKYIDLFFQKLRTHAATSNESLNIVGWYNYTTFDIIGDLSFGESFGSLERSSLHPWIAVIFTAFRQNMLLAVARKYVSSIDNVVALLFPTSLRALQQREQYTRDRIDKRLAQKNPRPDFVDTMSRADKGGVALTYDQITQNADVLVVAGSETTATVLSFATYLLCTHPDVMRKLTAEVDESFKSESEINLTSAQSLRYMLAVLNETMRMYPAVPVIPPRLAAEGGAEVFGQFVPEDTELLIAQYATYRYPGNFQKPDEFIPERWLGDPAFADDRRDAFHPFSHGPRDCIGKNLAYAEMRVILARMLFNFEIFLAEDSKGWVDDMHVWILWDKPEMQVKLKARR